MHALTKIAAAILLAAAPASATAQDYPVRSIRMIVPLTAGSGADIAGRIIGKAMSEAWRQPVVVENRPGAGGQIGTQAVAKSEPDGYTLLVQSASHAANSAIYKSLPYDPLKDLVDVARLGVTPYVMVTAIDGPYKSLRALIDAAKANPGNIPFASAGVGTSTHLAAEWRQTSRWADRLSARQVAKKKPRRAGLFLVSAWRCSSCKFCRRLRRRP